MIHNGDMFYVYEIFFNYEEDAINVNLMESRSNIWITSPPEAKEKVYEPFVEIGQGLHSVVRVKDKGSLVIMSDDTYFYVIDLANANQ